MKTFKIGIFVALAATVSFGSLVAFRSVSNAGTELLPIDKALYEKFLKSFPKVELPYAIKFNHPKTEADVEKMYGWSMDANDVFNQLDYEFAKFIPGLERGYMSRMGPDDFYSDALVAQNDKFSAVIYKRRPNYQNHISSYVLSTFDKTGKMISQRTIASCYADYFEEPTISKDLKISITHLKAAYKDDAEKSIEYSVEKNEQLYIDEKGAIVAAVDNNSNTPVQSKNTELKTTIKTDLWNN